MHIWNELTQTAGKQLGYGNMVGNIPSLINPREIAPGDPGVMVKGQILFVPLEFWFCRNPGLALPLIALQYHEVKVNVQFAPASQLYWSGPTNKDKNLDPTSTDRNLVTIGPLSASLYVDYIYLDTDERRRFAQVSHEYLIEQLQFTGAETYSGTTGNKIKLNFNHPTKELVWVVQPNFNTDSALVYGQQWYNYTDKLDTTYNRFAVALNDYATGEAVVGGGAAGGANAIYQQGNFDGGDNPVLTAQLQLNGHDRFSSRAGRYFNLVQPYQHHENIPSKGIYVYSFGLKPEEHQPSGTCNFSRIDNAVLSLEITSDACARGMTIAVPASANTVAVPSVAVGAAAGGTISVYAINYNVLRIMSGMGGLAYSN